MNVIKEEIKKAFAKSMKDVKENPQPKDANLQSNPFKTFLKRPGYSELVNGIFKRSSSKNQEIAKTKNKDYLPIKTQTVLSSEQIKKMIDGLSLILTPNDGNCFFTAVSNAINMYNNNTELLNKNKITYKVDNITFGIDVPFNQLVIRRVLVDNIFTDKSRYDDIVESVKVNILTLNSIVADEINTSFMGVDNIINTIDNVYNENKDLTFLIKKVTKLDDKVNGPFFVMMTEPEIIEYLLSSNYWGDQFAYLFIQSYLKLSIITIQNDSVSGNCKIIHNLLSQQNEANYPHLNDWDKYMFIYLSEGNIGRHYEGIKFNMYKTDSGKINQFTISIFDNSNFLDEIIPPFYMLVFIYGSYYYYLLNKDNNLLLKYPLKEIDFVFQNIISTPSAQYTKLQYSKTNNPKTQVDNFFKFFKASSTGSTNMKTEAIKTVNAQFNDTEWGKITGGNLLEDDQKEKEDKDTNYQQGGNKSKMSYYVNINMFLYENDKNNPPGKIPLNAMPELYCRQNTNNLEKAVADFLGVKHIIQPHYSRGYEGYKPPENAVTMNGGTINKLLEIKNKAIQNKMTKRKRMNGGGTINKLLEIKNKAIQHRLTRKIKK